MSHLQFTDAKSPANKMGVRKTLLWTVGIFLAVSAVVLAIVLPIVLTRHHTNYCSDRSGWQPGQPLSKCRGEYVFVVPPSSIPSRYRLVGGGTTPSRSPPSSSSSRSSSASSSRAASSSSSSSSSSAGRGGSSSSSRGRGLKSVIS